MMTVGTTVTSRGAETYFEKDLIEQELHPKTKSRKENKANNKAGKTSNTAQNVKAGITQSSEAGDAEAAGSASAILQPMSSAVEITKGENPKDENPKDGNESPADSPIENLSLEKIKNENLGGENSTNEKPVNLTTENSTTENTAAPVFTKSVVQSAAAEPIAVKAVARSVAAQPIIAETVGEHSKGSDHQIASVINSPRTRTLWVGKLAEELGLSGEVTKKDFASICRGIHPQTGEQLIRHVKPRTLVDKQGKKYQAKTHRAGLDQTLSAPKSVSLVASYDERVVDVHWHAGIKAITAIEAFTTAKMGNVKPPEVTGAAAYAAFLHFEARPDFKTGLAATDLHTHFFEPALARTADGQHRALETRAVYRCQKLATAVYRSELFKGMRRIGYEMQIDERTGAPEVASISRAYIEASSPRQTEIKRTAEELGIKSTKIVASNYRRGKNFDRAEMRRRWRDLDAEFGDQAATAAATARQRIAKMAEESQSENQSEVHISAVSQPLFAAQYEAEDSARKAAAALDFAVAQTRKPNVKQSNTSKPNANQMNTNESNRSELPRRQWVTRQSLLTTALTHSLTEIGIDEIKAEFTRREANKELDEFNLDRRGSAKRRLPENRTLEASGTATIESNRISNVAEPPFIETVEKAAAENTRVETGAVVYTRIENTAHAIRFDQAPAAEVETKAKSSPPEFIVQKPNRAVKVMKTDTAESLSTPVNPAAEDDAAIKTSPVEQTASGSLPHEPATVTDPQNFRERVNPTPPIIENSLIPLREIKPNQPEAIADPSSRRRPITELFIENYDEFRHLQSRAGKGASRTEVIATAEPIAGDTNHGNYPGREFGDDRSHGANKYTEPKTAAVGRTDDGGDSDSLAAPITAGGSNTPGRPGLELSGIAADPQRSIRKSAADAAGDADVRPIVGASLDPSGDGGEPSAAPDESNARAERPAGGQAQQTAQTIIETLDPAARRESGWRLESPQTAGGESAAPGHRRADDSPARRRPAAARDGEANVGADRDDAPDNRGIIEAGAPATEHRVGQGRQAENVRRPAELGTARSGSEIGLGAAAIKGSDDGFKPISNSGGNFQSADGGGFESTGFAGVRDSDGSQRAAERRTSTAKGSIRENERADKFDSATNRGGEEIGGIKGGEIREQSQVDGSPIKFVNRAADFTGAGSGMLLRSERGFEPGTSGANKDDKGTSAKAANRTGSQEYDGTELPNYCHDAAADVPGSGGVLRSTDGGADEDRSGNTDTSRRTAEQTAQIINVKRYSAGLDERIVAEWTAIIERSGAAEFFRAVAAPNSPAEERRNLEQLDAQAAEIADRLELPPPEPEATPNPKKLAAALTKIEVANYETATGERLGDEIFEVLMNGHLRAAADSTAALEAATLAALFDPAERGFDSEAITQAHRFVTEKAAAREAATLVQIAYGGEANGFTDNFRNDLATRFCYAPTPVTDIYQDVRQLDWRQTVTLFAPAVGDLAQQYQMEIIPPETDFERNTLLAASVTGQIVEAYESRNGSLEQYVQDQMTASLLLTGNMPPSPSQKATIAAGTEPQWKPPEFKSALEATAYNLNKYEEENKPDFAVGWADKIRAVERVRAVERAAAMEMQAGGRGLAME